MTDPLRQLLSRLDHEVSPVVTAADLKRWPAGAADAMIGAGLLREIEPATSIVYESCDERCLITPELIENSETGQVVGVYYCKRDGCGRITIEPDELRQWEPSVEAIASILASELELGTAALSIVPDRVYLLGTIPTGAGPLDVFLARGLTWDDAPTVIERSDRLIASAGPMVVVMRDLPPIGVWRCARPEAVSLSEYVSWSETESRIAFGRLSIVVRSLRPPVPQEQWLTVRECGELLLKDVSGIDIKKAMARVSWAASENKFRTNGRKGAARRIERGSFDTWRLVQRERDLDAADE